MGGKEKNKHDIEKTKAGRGAVDKGTVMLGDADNGRAKSSFHLGHK